MLLAIKSKVKSISRHHQEKLIKFRNRQITPEKISENKYIKHTVHNFSSYQLSEEEYKALPYGLDHHVPSKTNNNAINTQFEKFYQRILYNISHIPDDQLAVLKTRIPNTCHKYNRINVPYRYRQIIRNLSNNGKIKVLKQDKDRGVVIMDSSQYMKKCLDMLNNDNFIKLTDDPTKSIEGKIQRAIRKIKSKLSKDEYNKIYSTGSASGKLYGTANVHIMAENDNIDNLPLRPIISNIGTTFYHLAKHLAKLLSPLCHSEFTVKNTKALYKNLKKCCQ